MVAIYSKRLLASVLLLLQINLVFSQKLPSNADIRVKMQLANNYFSKKWPDITKPYKVENKIESCNFYSRAVYFDGQLALNSVFPDKKIIPKALNWGQFNKWKLANNVESQTTFDLAAGNIYLDLFLLDKAHPKRIAEIKANIDSLVNSYKVDSWTNIEAFYMVMPILAKMGVLYNDEKYFDKMYQMYMYSKNIEGLYNDQEFLWYRDKNFMPPFKTPKGQSCHWARGNGFVIAAFAKILDVMPSNTVHYDEYLDTFREMMIGLSNLQRADGFWNPSLTDGDHFGGKELTGTALITFGMAWGVRKNLIDKDTYTPVIAKAITAMLKDCVQNNGFLGWVQGSAKSPSDSQPVTIDKPSDLEDIGLGCFLLAGSEVVKLNNSKK